MAQSKVSLAVNGQEVAFVVAEDRYVAADAVKLVEVEYEPLPGLVDPLAALAIAMGQEIAYDELGNVTGGNLIDDFLPTTVETPAWETDFTVTPSPHHPIGAKGVGESPNVGGVSAFSNAVNDAFAHLGLTHTQMPHDHRRVPLLVGRVPRPRARARHPQGPGAAGRWRSYEPVARAMAAALPHVDCFAAAHTLETLAAIEAEVARHPVPRAGGGATSRSPARWPPPSSPRGLLRRRPHPGNPRRHRGRGRPPVERTFLRFSGWFRGTEALID